MALKILSVDDSKMIHTVIAKAFKNYNVEIFFASNGVEGLAVATREKPDIIILDVTMPVMDGVETLSKLKSDPSLKDIPVIMLTAEAGKENVIKIAKIGIRDYIIKPFTEQLVVERVGRVIDLQPKGSESTQIKSLDDPANVLVVEDKPAIIEQIKQGASVDTQWKITGVSQCGEAIDLTSRTIPDLILVSLSLPDKAAFNFFQMLRANARTKSVPIFGLSVKTATDEQTQAQNIGFTGIITKPLDVADMMFRLTRAMNLDTSSRYFTIEGDVEYVKIPDKPSTVMANEFSSYIKPKISEMVDSGLSKLIIDANGVDKIDMTIIKLMLQVVSAANELGIRFQVVGTEDFKAQAKTFEDTKDLVVHSDRESAIAAF